MKHASDEALDGAEPLLARLRLETRLQEKKRGVFYRRSQPFIHFHEDPLGLFADLKRVGGFTRQPVNTPEEIAIFFNDVEIVLNSHE